VFIGPGLSDHQPSGPTVGTPEGPQYCKGAQNCVALNRHAANVLPYAWDTVWRQFLPLELDKTDQNDGAREDRSSAVSETVDAGIWKS
jgi:hypothetical protein